MVAIPRSIVVLSEMILRDLTPLGNASIASLGVLFLGVAGPLIAQTTYTPYDFSDVGGTAGFASGTSFVAVDEGDNLYVATSNTIAKITPGGIATTLAGMPGIYGSADGTGSAARFDDPTGIAVDESGNVYVSDTENYTIRKVTPAGVVTTLAGSPGAYGSADGTGPAARFDGPQGIAVDTSGNVYVADEDANTIRKITPGGVVTTLAGTPGVIGSSNGTGSAAQFCDPIGVAVDGAGNVYVGELGSSTIRKITSAGVVTTLAGTPGNIGSADGTGSAAQFYWPTGVAVDGNGDVYVADTYNFTLRKVTSTGVVTTLAGIPGYAGIANGKGPSALFVSPRGVGVDGNGTLFVVNQDGIRSGHKVTQIPATISFDNLNQSYDGTAKAVSVTTRPPGLQTVVLYESAPGLSVTAMPANEGSYTIFAAILDPNYTGSAQGTLAIGPGLPAKTALVVRNTHAGGSFLWGIAAGPSGLVAVGTGGTILSSGNGSTWIQRGSGTTSWLTAATYGGGHYIAVGDNGCVLLSSDGIAWESVAQSATAARLNNVIFAAGRYVAVGEEGAIITSQDGRSWTAANSNLSGWLRGLSYVNGFSYPTGPLGTSTGATPGRFVAAGQGGAIISSTDGLNWNNEASSFGTGTFGVGQDLEALVTIQSSNYAGVGAAGTSIVSYWGTVGMFNPPPSETLISDPIPNVAADFRGLVQCGGSLYATGENGSIASAQIPSNTSGYDFYPVLGPWQQLASGTSADLVGGAVIGDSVYFVGDNETILELTAPYDSRLINLSCRAQVGTGANALVTGFVVGSQGTADSESLLIRSSGPALIPFGVSGTLPDPELQLYSTASGGSLLATNSGWGGVPAISNEAAAAGAFAWSDPSSHDAALLSNLGPGPYTANLLGESGDTGVALTEVYDATPGGTVGPSSARLINISARSQVESEAGVLIAGFVIGGSTPKTVLIRASGPALIPFGLSGTLPDPELTIYGSAPGNASLATNTGWGANPQIETAAAWVGAFSWGSAPTPDSAILITLPPGAYTAQVSGASGDTGIALVEVYEVH